MIASELLEIEAALLEVAYDIEDRDRWNDSAESIGKLRSLARRIAVQVESAKLRPHPLNNPLRQNANALPGGGELVFHAETTTAEVQR